MVPRVALRFLARVVVRFRWIVLAVAVLLTGVAGWSASRLEIKTGFSETLGDDEPVVRGWARLAENYPGAFAIQVAVEAPTEDRMKAVADELEVRFRERGDLVRDVYLKRDVQFFADRALLYLPVDEVRLMEASYQDRSRSLEPLLNDPSLLGLLRGFEELTRESFATSDTVSTISTRAFGRVLPEVDAARRPGLPGAEIGLSFDTRPLRDRIDAQAVRVLRAIPLPPSNESAGKTLEAGESVLDMVATVLESGAPPEPEAVSEEMDRLRMQDYEKWGLGAEYRISPDGSMLLMEVGAVANLTVLENIQPFLAFIREVVAEVQTAHPDSRIGLSGYAPGYEEQSAAILDNFILVTILGLVGVLAVFVIGFQRVALPSLAVVPLGMGVIWAMGIQGALVGQLNILTMVFPVILLGLGVDFAIHIIAAYAERRHHGWSPEASFVHVFDKVGPGLVTGAVTTTVAFFALTLASFKGFRDLGFIAGVGVATALIAMVTVLPALVAVWDDLRARRSGGRMLPDVPFAFLGPMGDWIRRNRYLVLALCLVATIALAYFVPKVNLDRDPLNMDPEGIASNELQRRIGEKFDQMGEVTVFFADDLDEARRIQERADAANTIGLVLSVTSVLPTDQAEKEPYLLRLQEHISALTPNPDPPEHTYDAAQLDEAKDHLARLKLALVDLSLLGVTLYEDDVQAHIGHLRDIVNRVERRMVPAGAERLRLLDRIISAEVGRTHANLLRTASNTSLEVDDLPASIADRLRGNDGTWMVITRAAGYPFEPDYLNAHIEELQAISPNFTGLIPIWHRMLTKVLVDLPNLVAITLAAVFLVVLIDMRSLRKTLLALVPVALGTVWTIGLMGVFGIDFNVISLMALPLIMGIGIDDGVHLLHRVNTEHDLGRAMHHSGKAIILTSLTTSIGFGSLLVSVHRGLFSLGLVVTLGIACCLVVTLVLVPALVSIFDEEALGPAEGVTRRPDWDYKPASAVSMSLDREVEE